MRPIHLGIGAIALAVLLNACSPSPSTSVPTSMPVSPATSAPTLPPEPTIAPEQASTPTSLDPCLLVPSQEASSLAGVTFGEGKEETVPGGAQRCVYGADTANVLSIEVAQAPDVATAQKDKDQFIADIQAQAQQLAGNGISFTEVPNFADGAVQAEMNVSVAGITVGGVAFAFLKGTVFFGITDVVRGQSPPSVDAVKGEAQTVLGRLP
jgi:hypothetical protein